MKIGITYRLFLAILAATFLAVLSNIMILHWSLRRGFLRYVTTMEQDGVARLAGKLEEEYGATGSWHGLTGDSSRWRRLLTETLPMHHHGPDGAPMPETVRTSEPPSGGVIPAPPRPELPAPPSLAPMGTGRESDGRPPPVFPDHFAERLFLLDAGRNVVAGVVPSLADVNLTPLHARGQTIGYLGLVRASGQLIDERQVRFLNEQKSAFALVGGVIFLLASGLSWLLARRLVRPLRGLTAATQQLSAGDYAIRVPVISSDEVGQLAGHFNTLAVTLQQNETARRQWVADISHELRTPLANLRCEIELLQDGLRPADAQALRSLHGEVLRLGLLVDDLYQLAMSDLGALTYRKEKLDLVQLLAEIIASFRPQFLLKGLALLATLEAGEPVRVCGDPERLRQLFSNLLSNALKYTDAGGGLRIVLNHTPRRVAVDFQDSAPGVAAADMERLFERLYRVENSRNRATGGAGLGLSICRNIVEAHLGTITAQPSPQGGLWVRVELELAEE